MRTNILNYLVCPKCQSKFLFSIHKKTKERIVVGELECKKCGMRFYIKDEIAYFVPCSKKQVKRDILKLRKTTTEQEIPKKWMRLFSKPELAALKKEWGFLLSIVKKNKSTIHLDFATGTGRFIGNVIQKTKGEIIALDNSCDTCQELKYFLKRIKKYNRVSIVCADAREMPFKNGIFDSVTSWHGLDEPKMKKVIKEAKRILKRDGYFAASGIHYQKGSKSFLRARKHSIDFLTKEEIIRTLKNVDFRKIEHRVFYEGHWNEKGDYLPMYKDLYISYAVSGKK